MIEKPASPGKCEFHSEKEWMENIEFEKLMYERRIMLETLLEPEEIEESLSLYEPTLRRRARVNVHFDYDLKRLNSEKDNKKEMNMDRYFTMFSKIMIFLGLVGFGIIFSSMVFSVIYKLFNS